MSPQQGGSIESQIAGRARQLVKPGQMDASPAPCGSGDAPAASGRSDQAPRSARVMPPERAPLLGDADLARREDVQLRKNGVDRCRVPENIERQVGKSFCHLWIRCRQSLCSEFRGDVEDVKFARYRLHLVDRKWVNVDPLEGGEAARIRLRRECR